MTDLVLVRHGETEWHAENRYCGSSDVALTDTGRAQAQVLAGWAAGAGLAAAWSSTLSRARETLAPAAAAAGLAPAADARLCELDFGEGEGRTLAEMRRDFGERTVEAFLADPAGHPLPGGEPPADAAARGAACLAEIAEAHPQARVLIVWHGTVLRLVLCRLLGIDPSAYRRVFPRVRNGAITEVRLSGGEAALLEYNGPVDRGGGR